MDPVIQVTEARLVNTLTSTSLTSRSMVISVLGRYNQKCSVKISALLLKRVDLAVDPAIEDSSFISL
jgi:hypothetical protein